MSSPTPRSVTPIIRWIRNFMAAVNKHKMFFNIIKNNFYKIIIKFSINSLHFENDITSFLLIVQGNFHILQRNVKDHQRFEHLYSPRNQPPPSIPGGIAHNLSHNYYHTRDGRRSVNPPTNSYSSAKLISANSKK